MEKTLKCLAVATLLVLPAGAASADPLASYTQTTGFVFVGPISEFDLGQQFQEIDMPLFDTGRGTLESVTLSVNMGISFEITNLVDAPIPVQSVPATLELNIRGTFLNYTSPTLSNMASSDGTEAFTGANFTQTFTDSDPDELGKFTAYNDFDIFVFGNIPSLQLGGYPHDTEFASYDFTETFSYAPATAIPEPGSTVLLLAGLVCTAGFAARRQSHE